MSHEYLIDTELNRFGNLDTVAVGLILRYLRRYGYLQSTDKLTANDVLVAVKSFQKFFALVQDGIPGPKTVRAMSALRCACVDMGENMEEAKAIWQKALRGEPITFGFASLVDGMSEKQHIELVQNAADSWSSYCKMNMKHWNHVNADVIIGAGRGQANNFDGASGTLAWAELPDGRDRQRKMMFDNDETWSISGRGIRFLNVACHELGHILGLRHSSVEGALMAPYYSANVAVPQQKDDVPRIQGLYGRRETAPNPTPTPTPTPGGKKIITIEVSDIIGMDVPGYRIIKV